MSAKSAHEIDLRGLFYPDCVAVIGATDREGSVGRKITENLIGDFEGKIVPVNPNRDEILGLKSYHDVASFSGNIDLAVIAVPPSIVNEVLSQVGEEEIRNVVVITAGFGEAGSEGVKREKELQEIAEKYGLRVVGPNSLGIINTSYNLKATFGPEKPLPGSISFMSQSGALVTAVLDWAEDHGVGFHNVVSLGNKAVLDETDFLSAWNDDENTDVIIGYLEGIEDGENFISVAREVSRSTPIVLIKSGSTESGARAVSSHTGTLAGSEEAYEAALKQAGVLRVDSLQELFDFAEMLEGQPFPETESVAIITNAGGPGVLATDALGASDLNLASFGDETIEKLNEFLPEEANIYNPIDVLGDADIERFRKTIEIVMEDPDIGSVILISYPSAMVKYEELAEEMIEVQSESSKPLVSCLMGGSRVRKVERELRKRGIPNYDGPDRAVSSLEALNRYGEIRQREYKSPKEFEVDESKAREVLAMIRDRNDNRLGVEAMGLLDAYGIPIPESEIVESPEEARQAADRIGDEVVMKIVSPDILHKSDIGGVKVGVKPEEVGDAYEDLVVRARNYQSDATLLGVQIQEMVDLDSGIETILGMNKDPQFGPLLMFGLGGIFVEILEDTSFRVAPINGDEAEEMVDELKSAPIFTGIRGQDPIDMEALKESIQRISQLVTDIPAILELDINPLLVSPEGVQAVDLRLTVDEEELGYES
ncbi:MAG: acetate--CoA ligase alpha subunit [Candidatus Hadarchaeota archaeon]